ncbi:CDGSH iron-sulfur domain-containing protein 2-like B [Holothuria leucospilota]|uniref:CDGSH iron-sulfur domain-containing protein 2-like B n=1 Tax=Holothuria leucospilota TaxID=206669 RepID=A0A9Q0YH51_HOLLE|nr:CDGSH iron-sulfur domain-containing protein 2-like B [Holothuria leucospilota]
MFSAMEGRDYLRIIPLAGAVGAAVFVAVYGALKLSRSGQVNHKYPTPKDQEKVKHVLDVEDLGDRTPFCRCWKSEKFPYCDGAHNEHNKTTGDNVGPIVMNRRNKSGSA